MILTLIRAMPSALLKIAPSTSLVARESLTLVTMRRLHATPLLSTYIRERPKDIREKRMSDPAKGSQDAKFKGERQFDWTEESADSEAEIFPTLETHKQLFNGVVYDELPICYIKATRNNTLVHFYTHDHEYITSTSARTEGFKNAKKKTEVAAQATGIGAAQRALRRGVHTVRVQINGIGPGRMAAPKGMVMAGLKIASVTDFTAIPEYFPRRKKQRRV